MQPLFAKLRQVCCVASDFDETVERLVADWGIGPFKCWHFRPPHLFDTTLGGAPAEWTMKLAITWLGDVQWEVIQPIEGATLYRKHLDAKGRGVQHLLMGTGDLPFEEAARRLADKGHPFGQTARLSIPARIGPLVLPALPPSVAKPAALHFGYIDMERTLRTSIELTRYPLGIPERAVLRMGEAEWCVPAGDRAFEHALPNRLVRRVVKIGIVTKDLEATARAWIDLAGVGPWHVWERPAPRHAFGARVGWAMLNDVLIEAVEPREGASPYHDVLGRRGEGVATVGVTPDGRSLAAVRARAEALGCPTTFEGSLVGDVPCVRIAARKSIATDLELLDPKDGTMQEAFDRVAPERVIA